MKTAKASKLWLLVPLISLTINFRKFLQKYIIFKNIFEVLAVLFSSKAPPSKCINELYSDEGYCLDDVVYYMMYPVVDCFNIFSGVVILITFDLGDKPSVQFGAFLSPITLALNGFRISDMIKSNSSITNNLKTMGAFQRELKSGNVLAWTYLAVFSISAVWIQQWLFISRDGPHQISRDQKNRQAIRRKSSSQVYSSCSQ